MPLVRFEPRGIELDVAPGERVLDATDEQALAVIPYACRSANCGTCRVVVIDGAEGLDPPGPDEARVLASIGAAADERLGCQLVVRGEAPIKLRVKR